MNDNKGWGADTLMHWFVAVRGTAGGVANELTSVSAADVEGVGAFIGGWGMGEGDDAGGVIGIAAGTVGVDAEGAALMELVALVELLSILLLLLVRASTVWMMQVILVMLLLPPLLVLVLLLLRHSTCGVLVTLEVVGRVLSKSRGWAGH